MTTQLFPPPRVTFLTELVTTGESPDHEECLVVAADAPIVDVVTVTHPDQDLPGDDPGTAWITYWDGDVESTALHPDMWVLCRLDGQTFCRTAARVPRGSQIGYIPHSLVIRTSERYGLMTELAPHSHSADWPTTSVYPPETIVGIIGASDVAKFRHALSTSGRDEPQHTLVVPTTPDVVESDDISF